MELCSHLRVPAMKRSRIFRFELQGETFRAFLLVGKDAQKARMSNSTAKAPKKAATVTPNVDHKANVLTDSPVAVPSKMTKATPRLEPLLMPKSDGSAKGFRNKVCIKRPETESPMPAKSAVMA